MDSIELYDLDWLEDAANLIEEYTDLEDDSEEQDAAMYVYGIDDVGFFEVFIATYLYCVDYHDGQYCREYEVLSQLKIAGLRVQGSIEDQDESIQDLYARMVEVHHA
jgi:heme/copper-type cytochrome/quinol oxidase subunit 3